MILSDLLSLIVILILGFLIAGALSPFEALGWWAGWFGRDREDMQDLPKVATTGSTAKHFIIFLSGIHSVSEESFAGREINLLNALKERLSDTRILELFPYSVSNRALTGQRFFAWFWRIALKLKFSRLAFAGFIINFRNVWQVMVSADKRYGPIYNQGSAESIARALLQNGYQVGSKTPVTLIGYSGGGQIAVGAASYLKEIIDAPIRVISLGGIVCSDPSLAALERLYQLNGEKDRVQRLAAWFFPGRWRILPYSDWNKARDNGLIQFVNMGPVDHTGKQGYLDSKQTLSDGRSYLEQTVDTIVAIIEDGSVAEAFSHKS